MLKWETIRDLFLIAMALPFLPYESRVFMFDTRPEDWYGELVISKGGQAIVLAKNSSAKKIALDLPSIQKNLQRQFDQKDAMDAVDKAAVLPLSYAILMADLKPGQMAQRKANVEGNYFFTPGSLAVCTRADYYVGFALVAAVMVCFILLTYVTSSYINEKSDAFADKPGA